MISSYMTDTGQARQSNQDFVFASEEPVGVLPNLFLVADGMGGHQGGGFASRYAAERLTELLNEPGRGNAGIVSEMNRAITAVNSELYQKASSFDELKGMGTTLVAASVQDHVCYVANVGDSRLYVIGEAITQITRDHSWVEEMIAKGRMARGSELYYQNKNVITRAVGARDTVTADFFEVELKPEDRLLLCSDGLTNMVEDSEILRIVKESSGCQEAVFGLIAAANANGGRDNISVLLVEPGADSL